MTLTITNILEDIITEIGQDTDDSNITAILLKCFKNGLRRLPAYINSRLVLTQENLTLAASAQTLDLTTLTSGFSKELNVWYLDTNSKRVIIVSPPDRKYFHQIYTTTAGAPSYYIITGKTMTFDKKGEISRTIGIEFFKEVSSVVGTDTFFGDDTLLEACKELCKYVYFRDYEEDGNKANAHKNDAKEILFELESDYEEREFGGHVKEGGIY